MWADTPVTPARRQRGEAGQAPQKSRYPRSQSRVQSANSRQKAKRPSSLKRKTSSSASYSNSGQPFSEKYLSTSHRSLACRSFETSLIWMGLSAGRSTRLPYRVGGGDSICQVAISRQPDHRNYRLRVPENSGRRRTCLSDPTSFSGSGITQLSRISPVSTSY